MRNPALLILGGICLAIAAVAAYLTITLRLGPERVASTAAIGLIGLGLVLAGARKR